MTVSSRLPLLLTALIAGGSYVIPPILRRRDDQHFVPPTRTPDELLALGACTGNFTIEHSSETLDRLQGTTKGKRRPVGTVRLSYITTLCDDNKSKSNKEHVVLLHGTGCSSKIYTHNYNDDEDEALWDFLRRGGYDVTAVDLRGHGLSEITDGPYSNELLAGDVAALIRQKFPSSSKIHCHGLSAGFGVCMAMAVFHADMTKTLTGNGFLFDRTEHNLVEAFFVSDFLRLIGMEWLGKMGEDGLYAKVCDQCHIDGFVHLAKSWFQFNVTEFLPTFQVPTLVLLPEKDAKIGYTREAFDKQMASMPSGMGRIQEFPGYRHHMVMEKGGSKTTFDAIHAFIMEKYPQDNHDCDGA